MGTYHVPSPSTEIHQPHFQDRKLKLGEVGASQEGLDLNTKGLSPGDCDCMASLGTLMPILHYDCPMNPDTVGVAWGWRGEPQLTTWAPSPLLVRVRNGSYSGKDTCPLLETQSKLGVQHLTVSLRTAGRVRQNHAHNWSRCWHCPQQPKLPICVVCLLQAEGGIDCHPNDNPFAVTH